MASDISGEHYFRGLPSAIFVAEATIQLLVSFGWNRIGVIYSDESPYAMVSVVMQQSVHVLYTVCHHIMSLV